MKTYWVNALINTGGNTSVISLRMGTPYPTINEAKDEIIRFRLNHTTLSAWITEHDTQRDFDDYHPTVFHECYVDSLGNITKPEEFWYELHWKDGTVNYIKGVDERHACMNSGIKFISTIDYISKCNELPINNKEIYYTPKYPNWNTTYCNRQTLFAKNAMQQIKNVLDTEANANEFEIHFIVGSRLIICDVNIKPFEIHLKEK